MITMTCTGSGKIAPCRILFGFSWSTVMAEPPQSRFIKCENWRKAPHIRELSNAIKYENEWKRQGFQRSFKSRSAFTVTLYESKLWIYQKFCMAFSESPIPSRESVRHTAELAIIGPLPPIEKCSPLCRLRESEGFTFERKQFSLKMGHHPNRSYSNLQSGDPEEFLQKD
jgi:hypothetical protein